jgi:hypothetical protein
VTQSLHRFKKKGFQATQSLHCFKKKGFRATQSLHRFSRMVKGPKNRKIAVFKKGLKRQNRFIGSILRVQSISVALVDPFFMDRAHHCL